MPIGFCIVGGNSNWRGPVWMPMMFYEYFHGDNARGVGASHQTGWTGVVAELINRVAKAEAKQGKNDYS